MIQTRQNLSTVVAAFLDQVNGARRQRSLILKTPGFSGSIQFLCYRVLRINGSGRRIWRWPWGTGLLEAIQNLRLVAIRVWSPASAVGVWRGLPGYCGHGVDEGGATVRGDTDRSTGKCCPKVLENISACGDGRLPQR
jgi:hypothetical protein